MNAFEKLLDSIQHIVAANISVFPDLVVRIRRSHWQRKCVPSMRLIS
jgi:hypothetical protein